MKKYTRKISHSTCRKKRCSFRTTCNSIPSKTKNKCLQKQMKLNKICVQKYCSSHLKNLTHKHRKIVNCTHKMLHKTRQIAKKNKYNKYLFTCLDKHKCNQNKNRLTCANKFCRRELDHQFKLIKKKVKPVFQKCIQN